MKERYLLISKPIEIAAIDQFLRTTADLKPYEKIVAIERHGKGSNEKVIAIVKGRSSIIT